MAVNDVGCVHLCLMVHDISDAYEALTKRGIEFVGPPAQVTFGVNRGLLLSTFGVRKASSASCFRTSDSGF